MSSELVAVYSGGGSFSSDLLPLPPESGGMEYGKSAVVSTAGIGLQYLCTADSLRVSNEEEFSHSLVYHTAVLSSKEHGDSPAVLTSKVRMDDVANTSTVKEPIAALAAPRLSVSTGTLGVLTSKVKLDVARRNLTITVKNRVKEPIAALTNLLDPLPSTVGVLTSKVKLDVSRRTALLDPPPMPVVMAVLSGGSTPARCGQPAHPHRSSTLPHCYFQSTSPVVMIELTWFSRKRTLSYSPTLSPL